MNVVLVFVNIRMNLFLSESVDQICVFIRSCTGFDQFMLGLHDILHAIVMLISSVKPVM